MADIQGYVPTKEEQAKLQKLRDASAKKVVRKNTTKDIKRSKK